MKVLSTKLELIGEFTAKEMDAIIIKWLKSSEPCKAIGTEYENLNDKSAVHLKDEYCQIDTFRTDNDSGAFTLFKFEQLYYEQLWITEIILKATDAANTLYIHVECNGDTTRFEKVPIIRTDIIRAFVNSKYIAPTEIPITSQPVYTTEEMKDIIADGANGNYNLSMPMVFATKIFDSAGYEIDIDNLARRLAGMAYIVAENEDGYARSLKEKTNGSNPYNRHVAIYYPGRGKSKNLTPRSTLGWGTLDKMILNEVAQYMTAQVDAEAPTWKELHVERMTDEVKVKSELLDEFDAENESLEERLKKAQQRIQTMQARIEMLEQGQRSGEGGGLLNITDNKEFYDYEQYDLIMTILTNALQNYTSDTRAYELLSAIIENNPIKGYGKEIFERIKQIFARGEGIGNKEFAELKELGFEVVSEKNHYKIVFQGDERYWFPISKTPSDARSGKNLASDIIKKISIYK